MLQANLKLPKTRKLSLLPFLLFAVALLFWGQALWIYVKAHVAQILIANAWERSLAVPGETHKPWYWADTWPVLHLRWQRNNADSNDFYVLAGAGGSALAFGPGLLSGPSTAGSGLKVIAAHRDTHFEFLEDLQAGDTLSLQDISGEWHAYEVAETIIVDTRTSPLYVDPSIDALLLITCYPFHAVNPGGPLRYLVKAHLASN